MACRFSPSPPCPGADDRVGVVRAADDRRGHGNGDRRRGPGGPVLRRRRGAGARAGAIRHAAEMFVLWPRGASGEILPDRPRRPRRLTDEEIGLWAEVARTVQRRRGVAPAPEPPPAPGKAAVAAPPLREPARARSAGPPPLAPLDRKQKRNLARGRGGIDGALDLHGLTQAEAHHALRGFLVGAQARGDRLVIVVTGKGRASSWIDEPRVALPRPALAAPAADLRGIVLGFEEAGRAHGGAGALYVRLRRAR